jgi:thiol:disulfide interchange protein DsbA
MTVFTKNFALQKSLCAVALAVTFAGCSGPAAAADPFTAGKDYGVLKVQGPIDVPGKIEVREFFWYGCPHCFRLDPFITTWLKTKPADINFVRTPAALNERWEQNARGYYSLELMGGGLTEKLHTPLFEAIQLKNQQLFDQTSLASFYASQGVDANKFNGLYNSFAVSGKVAQSKRLAIQYQLEGVPALVVNGKYVVSGEDGKALQVVNFLINKIRTEKK